MSKFLEFFGFVSAEEVEKRSSKKKAAGYDEKEETSAYAEEAISDLPEDGAYDTLQDTQQGEKESCAVVTPGADDQRADDVSGPPPSLFGTSPWGTEENVYAPPLDRAESIFYPGAAPGRDSFAPWDDREKEQDAFIGKAATEEAEFGPLYARTPGEKPPAAPPAPDARASGESVREQEYVAEGEPAAPSFSYKPFQGKVTGEDREPAETPRPKKSFAFIPSLRTAAKPGRGTEPDAADAASEEEKAIPEFVPPSAGVAGPEEKAIPEEIPVVAEAERPAEDAIPEAASLIAGARDMEEESASEAVPAVVAAERPAAAVPESVPSAVNAAAPEEQAVSPVTPEAPAREEAYASQPERSEPPAYEPYEAPAREETYAEPPAYKPYEAPPREETAGQSELPGPPAYEPYEAPPREETAGQSELPGPPAYEPYEAPPREETYPPTQPDAESTNRESYTYQPPAVESASEADAGDMAAYASYAGAGGEERTEDSVKTVSVIAEDAYIDGNITTSGNIEVMGGISGDVSAKGAIDVRGAIRGNVSGEKLGLYGCTVQGDIKAGSGILVDAGSMVIGNVKTKNIYLDGKLKGNIESEDVSLLRSNAYYVGDIVTGSIAIEGGATISGNIRTLIEGDVEDPFRPDRISDML
jgi:cytoskeletal protein CcmA (bactofilin family)